MATPSLGFNLNPSGNQSPLPQGGSGFSLNYGNSFGTPSGSSATSSPAASPVPAQPGVPNLPGNIVTQGSALPGGQHAESPLDPTLTGELYSWLQSQIGQGMPAYPGQLTAPVDPTISQIASNDYALTDFDAVQAAMQRSIQEGQANLTGQFAFAGGLAGSPFGTASADYQNQAALNLQSVLAQMELQAAPTRLAAGEAVQTQEQLGLTNAYQEWLREQPQYNPLLNLEYGAANTFAPIYSSSYGTGGLSAALSALPAIGGMSTGGGGTVAGDIIAGLAA